MFDTVLVTGLDGAADAHSPIPFHAEHNGDFTFILIDLHDLLGLEETSFPSRLSASFRMAATPGRTDCSGVGG
jgi:hypothetical protein